MNKIISVTLLMALMLITSNSYSQQQDRPVKWTATVEQTKPDSATLVFTATIDKDWHIYSQFTPDGGPIATTFTYSKTVASTMPYIFVGKTTEPKADEAFDKDFGVKILTLQGKPIFRQLIALKDKKKITIPVKIEYEACKDKCLFLDTSFVMTINPMVK